jgi:stage II sporulation protein D (peptidoglycan lytic transglycosylase)
MPITKDMKRWEAVYGLAIAAGIAASACASASARAMLPSAAPESDRTLTVKVAQEGNAVRRIPLERYVEGTAVSEFAPPDGEIELVERMLEVQAVIARTYALANSGRHAKEGFDLCSTTHCQLYEPSRLKTSRWAAAAREAVARTAGAVLFHDRAPVLALFNADCGGYTNTSVNAWGGTPRPYLVAMADDDVDEHTHSTWRYEAPVAAMLRALNADRRTRVGTRIDSISIVSRDLSGRAEIVALNGQIDTLVRGEELRAVLTRQFGARTVKSAMFDVRRERGVFVFEGRGFGHGVGLCQAGALARLRAGATPAAVLQRYFPNTRLRTLGH